MGAQCILAFKPTPQGVKTRVRGYNQNSPCVWRLLPCQCKPCHRCSHSFLEYVKSTGFWFVQALRLAFCI